MANTFPYDDGDSADASIVNGLWGYAETPTQVKIGATETAATTNFANPLRYMIIRNLGPNVVYVSTKTTATASDYELGLYETRVYDGGNDGIANLYSICGAGETADIRVLGTY